MTETDPLPHSHIEEGTHERWDSKPGSFLRGVLCCLPTALCAFGLAGGMVLMATLAPRTFKRHRSSLVRRWGRVGLFISGVRLEAHGVEHLDGAGGRIVLFNHQSLLDLFILASLWAEHGVVVYKQEFHRVPIIGRLMKELDLIPVDRSNRERAVYSMTTAGRRVRDRGETLLVAPEGTRSKKHGLIDFKRGAFHVAVDTGLPIVVFVMRGVRTLMPAGRFVVRSGAVRVDVLPPVPTTGWVESDLNEHIAQVRQVFLRYLPDAGSSPRRPSTRESGSASAPPGDFVTAGPE